MRDQCVVRTHVVGLSMPQIHWTPGQQYSLKAICSCAERIQSPRRNSLFSGRVVGSEICSTIPRVKAHN